MAGQVHLVALVQGQGALVHHQEEQLVYYQLAWEILVCHCLWNAPKVILEGPGHGWPWLAIITMVDHSQPWPRLPKMVNHGQP